MLASPPTLPIQKAEVHLSRSALALSIPSGRLTCARAISSRSPVPMRRGASLVAAQPSALDSIYLTTEYLATERACSSPSLGFSFSHSSSNLTIAASKHSTGLASPRKRRMNRRDGLVVAPSCFRLALFCFAQANK